MGFRTWLFKKTGLKLKKIDQPNLAQRLSALEQWRYDRENPKPNIREDLTLGKDVHLAMGLAHPYVEIGDYTYIGHDFYIQYGTIIGKYCSIAPRVQIGAYPHPTHWLSTHPFQGFDKNPEELPKTIIGHDVWIGVNAVIIPGVTVGNGAIIGAGAVVTKNVPPYAIVGGVPAKVIHYRFNEATIQELLAIEWWNIDRESLLQNSIDFQDISKAITQIKALRSTTQQ